MVVVLVVMTVTVMVMVGITMALKNGEMKVLQKSRSPLKPIPLYTVFPHPKYATLGGLTSRLNTLSKKKSDNVPSLLLIEDGIHDGRSRISKKIKMMEEEERLKSTTTPPPEVVDPNTITCSTCGKLQTNEFRLKICACRTKRYCNKKMIQLRSSLMSATHSR